MATPESRKSAMPLERLDRARRLREDSTPPERRVWSRLRAGRLAGLKFRRQHPIGPFVADFYCHEARLIVEIDGLIHNQKLDRDRARDATLQAQGVRVVRIPAWQVKRDLDQVVRDIAHAAAMQLGLATLSVPDPAARTKLAPVTDPPSRDRE